MRKQATRHNISGYTLIELILVTAIIAAIAVLGLAAYKQKVMNMKIDKTALQMQMWLQAGMAYYVDNGEWPGKDTPDQGAKNAQELITQGYMPELSNNGNTNNKASNPWGKPYLVKVVQSSSEGNNPRSNFLEVDTTIPADIGPESSKIAEMIAARVPAGKSTGNIAIAYANIPGQSSNAAGDGSKIIDVLRCHMPKPTGEPSYDDTLCQNGIPVPSCSSGYKPEIKVSLANFETQSTKAGTKATIHDIETGAHKEIVNGEKVWKPYLNITTNLSGVEKTKGHKGDIVAITMCQKDPQQQANNSSGFLF